MAAELGVVVAAGTCVPAADNNTPRSGYVVEVEAVVGSKPHDACHIGGNARVDFETAGNSEEFVPYCSHNYNCCFGLDSVLGSMRAESVEPPLVRTSSPRAL